LARYVCIHGFCWRSAWGATERMRPSPCDAEHVTTPAPGPCACASASACRTRRVRPASGVVRQLRGDGLLRIEVAERLAAISGAAARQAFNPAKPVGGPSIAVQPPSTNKVLPVM